MKMFINYQVFELSMTVTDMRVRTAEEKLNLMSGFS